MAYIYLFLSPMIICSLSKHWIFQSFWTLLLSDYQSALWIHFFILISNISWFNLFGFIANLSDELDFHMAFMDILLHLYFSTSKWFLKFWISNPKNSHSFFFWPSIYMVLPEILEDIVFMHSQMAVYSCFIAPVHNISFLTSQ